MRIPRIFTDQALEPGRTVRLDRKSGHYLSRVLRLQTGDRLVLFSGDGADYAASIAGPARDAMEVSVESRLPAVPESRLRITLAQAIARGERMDLALQKATELGAAVFRPIFTDRVEVRLDERRTERRMAHWLGVIRAACEQSGRAVIPELLPPARLEDLLLAELPGQRFLLDGKAVATLSGQTISGTEVHLLIGPEGGWTNCEVATAERSGFRPVRLGPRILRTETAGPAAIAVLQAMGGDF